MLKTKLAPEEGALEVDYDGHEFGIILYAADCIGVTCKRRGEWDFYERKPYRTVAEACKAIFYGTILVDRTESGFFTFDEFGSVVDFRPLTYYDRAA